MFEKLLKKPAMPNSLDTDAADQVPPTAEDETLKHEVIEVLRTIYDPEIPVNIYDLGLIYEVHATEHGSVYIIMTLTTPGCPVAQSFPGTVQAVVMTVPGVIEAHVDIVWDPPWSQDKMSDAAKLQLGLY
jgi:FeS assembly SUF system protein